MVITDQIKKAVRDYKVAKAEFDMLKEMADIAHAHWEKAYAISELAQKDNKGTPIAEVDVEIRLRNLRNAADDTVQDHKFHMDRERDCVVQLCAKWSFDAWERNVPVSEKVNTSVAYANSVAGFGIADKDLVFDAYIALVQDNA